MRGAVLGTAAAAFAIGVAFDPARGASPADQGTDDGTFVRGVALGLFATDPGWDYGPLVEEIRGRGATDVLVVVNAYQSDRFASDVSLRPGVSPTHATVARTITQVREAGMRAALMPVVRLERRAPHEWRGRIAPADGLDAWFAAYRGFVLPLATIAEERGAERFVVGSELSSLEPHTQRWRALISQLRSLYSGTLTYSANWDRIQSVEFWDALDEIGLTAYFPLAEDREAPSDEAIAQAWRSPRTEIGAIARRAGKPVLVTEVGYVSQRGAAGTPWAHSTVEVLDLHLQQRLYRGFCDAFAQTPSVLGFYVWNWFGFGGPLDRGFTPRGKPAANELAKCFERAWTTPAHVGNDDEQATR